MLLAGHEDMPLRVLMENAISVSESKANTVLYHEDQQYERYKAEVHEKPKMKGIPREL